ncbi:MAG: 50S ribosomal protein L7ae [Clostridium sp.]|nr:50S ribosomal protein L7ae [Clostridium sp.]
MGIFLFSLISLYGCGLSDNFYNNQTKLSSSSDTWSVTNSTQSIDDHTYNGCYNFTGYGTLWSYNSDEDKTITAPYSLNVKSGQAKLILITQDNEVSTILENSKNTSVTEGTLDIHIKKGLNRIKFVGNEADTELQITIEEGTLKTIDV